MIVDSKYEANTWQIMAIDMWQRSRRNPTTKNDTSSKYLNLIYTLLCHVERERSEDTFTCFQWCSSSLSTSNLYAVNATTFLVHLLVLVENTNTSAISIEYASMLSGEVAYTSDIEIRYKIQCSKSNLNNDDGNGIVALHKGTVLTFTVNQFATCDISYVLRIKTSEFICKESVHILCALSMKQYWSNLVFYSSFHKQKRYIR